MYEPSLTWLEPGMLAFLAALIVASAGAIWRPTAVRYREITGHLADLRRLQEAHSMQLGYLPQIVETGAARHHDDSLSRGDLDEKAATIRMRIRRRGVGMIAAA